MCLGRNDSGFEQADNFAGLFGRDSQWGKSVQVLGDVAVVAIPVAPDGRERDLDGLAVAAGAAENGFMLGRFGRAVDVAGAEGVFLGVDSMLDEPSSGTNDPPAGPVDSADSARFHLKDDVVKLEHHAAVAAAVNAFPGGGGDPCGHAMAGPQSELKGLIDQVSAPVVQDRSRHVRAPTPGRGGA